MFCPVARGGLGDGEVEVVGGDYGDWCGGGLRGVLFGEVRGVEARERRGGVFGAEAREPREPKAEPEGREHQERELEEEERGEEEEERSTGVRRCRPRS